MSELFKTVLIMSILGTVLFIPLLALKPITSKKFPAIWQYIIWITVMLSMVVPTYKLLPAKKAESIPPVLPEETVHVIPVVPTATTPSQPQAYPQASQTTTHTNTENTIKNVLPQTKSKQIDFRLDIPDFIAYIWLFGMCIFFITVTVSYAVYLAKKRKNTLTVSDNNVLNEVRHTLGIKRNIKIRTSPDVRSPMLVGVIFPTVYLPCREISDEQLKMIFLHELTHYKRKDLFFKWLSLFSNAMHWFNPFAYLLCSNLSEACEISCDMSVTKSMSDTEQKTYMKTILDLVE